MKIKNTELEIVRGSVSQAGADYIVPPYKGKVSEQALREYCKLQLAEGKKRGARTLAFPALGCASGQLPVVGSAKIMAQEVMKFAKNDTGKVQSILFCIEDEKLYNQFYQTVSGYVTHIQDTLGDGPYVTVDIIIELKEGIILIERSNPPFGWALPGGFVDCGESLEQTAIREAKEETNMELEDLCQMHTYSDPDRDPRFHTVTTVFIAKGRGTPQFGDDAKGLKVVPYNELTQLTYAFDHNKVIEDYLKQRS